MTLQNFDTVLGFAIIMFLLSMIITVLVQFVVAILSLRGRNLRAGLIHLLQQASPDMTPHAADIAHAVLHHPAIAQRLSISDKLPRLLRWPAKAITQAELLHILDDLAT